MFVNPVTQVESTHAVRTASMKMVESDKALEGIQFNVGNESISGYRLRRTSD